jgi:hypothetical protein
LQEYALTDDIAGMAAGGQILMGPKTFQRQVNAPQHLSCMQKCMQHAELSVALLDCRRYSVLIM